MLEGLKSISIEVVPPAGDATEPSFAVKYLVDGKGDQQQSEHETAEEAFAAVGGLLGIKGEDGEDDEDKEKEEGK